MKMQDKKDQIKSVVGVLHILLSKDTYCAEVMSNSDKAKFIAIAVIAELCLSEASCSKLLHFWEYCCSP